MIKKNEEYIVDIIDNGFQGEGIAKIEGITVFIDQAIKGEKIKIKAKGLLAQAICHELDHLDGVLFIDHMIPGTLEYVEPQNK